MTSSAPPTLNRSVIAVDISALRFICSRVIVASRRPRTRAGIRKIGSIRIATTVNCQLSTSIAPTTRIRLMMFETTPDSVEVKACWAPITSLFSRETSAPVCVRVKNATGIRWTCENTLVRRSKISPSPIRAENQRCIRPSAGLDHREHGDDQSERGHQRRVPLADAVVDDLLEQQR